MARRKRTLNGAHRTSGGFTLIESLIAVVVISTVVFSAAVAIAGMHRATASASTRARIETALAAYGEAVKAATFVPCATTATYADAPWTAPAGMAQSGAGKVQSITSIVHFRGAGPLMASCAPGPAQDSRQQLTIEISYQGRTVAADIVKRDPAACPDPTCP